MDVIAPAVPPVASREDCLALDRADPLAALRDEFSLPDGVVYLDGNSLGALPRRTAARLAEVTEREWGEGLIRSWNDAGWIDLSQPHRRQDRGADRRAARARSASPTRPRSTCSSRSAPRSRCSVPTRRRAA